MIRAASICKHFGGLLAVDQVSLTIAPGTITGLIGANGAGKTTLFNIIAGEMLPSAGRVFLGERDITGLPSYELCTIGMARTFQIAREFRHLTVLENVLCAAGGQSGENILNAWLARRRWQNEERQLRRDAEDILDFLKLSHLADAPAGILSGGQKKLLELGRVMMAKPQMVLLDEVGAGVNKTLLGDIATAILRLNAERGITFFMIEHDLDFLGRLCSSVIVMANGAVLARGSIDEIKNNEAVIESYLGRRQGER